jgi:ribosomal-protein-alanine N-acetyltransferase
LQLNINKRGLKMELLTERLLLKTLDLDLLDAAVTRTVNAIAALGYRTNGEWPGDDFVEAIPYFRERLIQNNGTKGFDSWIMVKRETNEIVGGIGFVGDPDPNYLVEIGFATNKSHRRQGYCREAAQVLIGWALSQAEVKGVKACCEPNNHASQRVLERLGFTVDHRDPELIYWQHRVTAAVDTAGRLAQYI